MNIGNMIGTIKVNQRLIRLPQVLEMVGLGKTIIYGKIKAGTFPRQVKLGRISGWVESEVQDWISQQIRGRSLMRQCQAAASA